MKFTAISLVTLLVLILLSCTTYEPLTPPADFDKNTYINPEVYGANLDFRDEASESVIGDMSFTPVKMEGGYRKAFRSNSFKPFLGSTPSGGARVRVYVDSTGTLQHVERIDASNRSIAKELEELAIENSYKPAILNGKAVNSFRDIEVYLSGVIRSVRREI